MSPFRRGDYHSALISVIIIHVSVVSLTCYIRFCFNIILKTRTLGAYGPLVLDPAEGVGALWAPCIFLSFFSLYFLSFLLYFCCIFCIFVSLYFLYFCLLVFLSFCLFAFLPFCLFVFLPFCLFAILPFCLFAFLSFCLFVFLSFCLFVFLSFCHQEKEEQEEYRQFGSMFLITKDPQPNKIQLSNLV